MMKKLKFIGVSGFFSSGSSAVVDFLREFDNVYECESEIRIIKDPYGISQLEQSLVHHWELLNSSAAINDFLWLCNIYNRKRRHVFSPIGLSYNEKINPDFLKITSEYINELIDFRYQSDFYYQKIKKGYFKYIVDKIRYGIEVYTRGALRVANRNNKTSYFACPTEAEFIASTRKFLKALFENCLPNDVTEGYILLDQAISTNDTNALDRYFGDGKLIIVDRDPRDMYIEDTEIWRENLDSDVASSRAGEKYCMKHKALRKDIFPKDNILLVRFEDLVSNYKNESQRILKFTGVDQCAHLHPYEYFNPDISSKNIGVWKRYYSKYKEALDVISNNLPEYCID